MMPYRRRLVTHRPPFAATAKALFFGDSISDETFTQGGVVQGAWCASLRTTYGWAATNTTGTSRAAILGTSLQNIPADPTNANNGIATYATRISAFTPDIIFMLYGANDWYWGTTVVNLSTWRTALQTILAAFNALATKPAVVVVGVTPCITTPPPGSGAVPVSGWNGAANTAQMIEQMEIVTAEETMNARALWVPIRQVMTQASLVDGLHPNAVGHAQIASAIVAALGGA